MFSLNYIDRDSGHFEIEQSDNIIYLRGKANDLILKYNQETGKAALYTGTLDQWTLPDACEPSEDCPWYGDGLLTINDVSDAPLHFD